LPKYSPDLNPIEMLFSKLKHWLRHAVGRSLEAICSILNGILSAIPPLECRNYFIKAGYDPT
jgi:putative transposase